MSEDFESIGNSPDDQTIIDRLNATIETRLLVEALLGRYDDAVFIGLRRLDGKAGESEFSAKGEKYACRGLAATLLTRLSSTD